MEGEIVLTACISTSNAPSSVVLNFPLTLEKPDLVERRQTLLQSRLNLGYYIQHTTYNMHLARAKRDGSRAPGAAQPPCATPPRPGLAWNERVPERDGAR